MLLITADPFPGKAMASANFASNLPQSTFWMVMPGMHSLPTNLLGCWSVFGCCHAAAVTAKPAFCELLNCCCSQVITTSALTCRPGF